MKRLIAIGDIHGQLNMLVDLLNQIQPSDEDLFVFLGDYIDRGPNSAGVIHELLGFRQLYPQTIFLRGNHEQLFLDALNNCGVVKGKRLCDLSDVWARESSRYSDVSLFKLNGGAVTLKSYNVEIVRESPEFILVGEIPHEHIDFLQETPLSFEYENFIFVHAGLNPYLPMQEQNPYVLLWDRSLGDAPEGKTLVVGHTPTVEGEPLVGCGRSNNVRYRGRIRPALNRDGLIDWTDLAGQNVKIFLDCEFTDLKKPLINKSGTGCRGWSGILP